uniref:Protein CDV3 n=1 Tax=Schizaphis graminum TaxID=13262 RepID=A0A2S2P0M7_SCHGA
MEEEWNEYQEEIKDYTTLKMQNLTADCPSNFTDNNDKDDEIEFEENEAGEMVPKRKNAGPWKLNEPEQPPPPPKAAPPVVAEVQKNVYVPPAQRNNFQGGHRSAPRNKSNSLDVKDEEMFPTLSSNNSTKKSVAPTARKVETPAWAKYQ